MRTHVRQATDTEHKQKRRERDAAFSRVAEEFGSLTLTCEGMDRADSNEDKGVAARRRRGDDDSARNRSQYKCNAKKLSREQYSLDDVRQNFDAEVLHADDERRGAQAR